MSSGADISSWGGVGSCAETLRLAVGLSSREKSITKERVRNIIECMVDLHCRKGK
jgi:hypothetical protein